MQSIKTLLDQATSQLKGLSSSARLDAELLLAHALSLPRTYLYSHPEIQLNPEQCQHFQQLLHQRKEGVPIAYLTGTREFWSLPFQVNPHTLIPRPETELIVEIALRELNPMLSFPVLELGAGSGAIALALATERPQWQLIATDISDGAVATMQMNMAHLNISNVQIVQADWFTGLPGQSYAAILSNPPYIAANDPHLAQGDLRFEPHQALVSGNTGLEALYYLIDASYARLAPGGLLLLEHGCNQRQAVTQRLRAAGYQAINCWQDYQGHDRVSGGRRI